MRLFDGRFAPLAGVVGGSPVYDTDRAFRPVLAKILDGHSVKVYRKTGG
jgi:hypothetical protein